MTTPKSFPFDGGRDERNVAGNHASPVPTKGLINFVSTRSAETWLLATIHLSDPVIVETDDPFFRPAVNGHA